MAYLATNKDGKSYVFADEPIRYGFVKIQVSDDFWESVDDEVHRDVVEYMVVENIEAIRTNRYRPYLSTEEYVIEHSFDDYIEWGVPRESMEVPGYIEYEQGIEISSETVYKIIGKKMTFEDNPIKI